MRNSTLLCWRNFLGIALQARHLNENLEENLKLESFSVSSVCSVDFLSSEFRRILNGYFLRCASTRNLWRKSVLKWLEARNYSIAYEPKSLNKNL